MSTDTVDGNKAPSEKLKVMLVNLRDTISSALDDAEDRIEKIRLQAHSENFSNHEIDLLLTKFLSGLKTKRQLKWMLTDKPRIREQKKLMEKRDINVPIDENNVPEIPVPGYDSVVPEQVIDIVAQEQEQQQVQEQRSEVFKKQKPNYEVEQLKLQLDTTQANLDQSIANQKNLENFKPLEALARLSPIYTILPVNGNTIRIKVVVSNVFREVLALRGSKVIYANIVIDTRQNKYVKLEPIVVEITGAQNRT
jgi:hypothetical protein